MDPLKRHSDLDKDLMNRSKMRSGQYLDENNQEDLNEPNYLFGGDALNKGMNQGGMHNAMMVGGPQQNGMNMIASDEHNMNYYQEYCRLFIANVVLTTQMKELVSEKNELLAKLAKLEQKKNEDFAHTPNSNNESYDDKKKRFRRTASEIDRHYRCPVESCQKAYGFIGSLNQHIKLKHPNLATTPDLKLKLMKKETSSNSGEQAPSHKSSM